MKKIVYLIITCLLFAGCASSHITTDENIKLKPVKTVPIEKNAINLNYTEIEEYMSYSSVDTTLNYINWLMSAVCVEYDDAVENGYDFETFKADVKNHIPKTSKISINEFILAVRNALLPYFNDYHMAFYGYPNFRVPVCVDLNLFYSNIYVEKKDNKFVVVKSDNPDIAEGEIYKGSEENLFYYPSKGENVYRYGFFADNEYFIGKFDYSMWTKTREEKFGDKTVTVTAKFDQPLQQRQTLRFGEIETEKSAYLSLSTFGDAPSNSIYKAGTDKNFKKWFEAAVKYHNKENLIIDLRSNNGGKIDNAMWFCANLYSNFDITDGEKWNEEYVSKYREYTKDFLMVESEPILKFLLLGASQDKDTTTAKKIQKKLRSYYKDYVKNYFYYADYDLFNDFYGIDDTNFSEKKAEPFKGKLFIIVDKNSASASEEFISLTKFLFGNENVYVLGQNSNGCISYSWVNNFPLTGTTAQISLCLTSWYSAIEKNPSWHGEGKGFYPDYWCSYEDLLDTIVLETKDEALREKLQYIGYALQ